ncbi:PREDICTED: 3-oxoacyl-[acyl-carrier-protein] reductase FabG-like [Rhagoletis zephyria]|uniref:3-oxoacyl-[acyl-carrier-protein] reductase FabG-like n=1 Tax=Rhagoletis zephyria TaxID=28612 RepID=UPI000811314A|nr:PREDICTED: 3-oxoacyl-[acyl-carrier-protein] reductase FabG-like [Rhagoletis zephyria]XP_017482357.1 PREDICTED: 3-oxoacyl-[acyl-carrier-protein] reductase FabG-like [Rhagoletis zephyria]
MDFKGKVVLITGASSGIGAATAVKFAKLGAKLVLVARNVENLKATGEKCLKAAGAQGSTTPLLIKTDLSDEKAVPNIITDVSNKFGQLDVLVNNAGIIENGSIENTSLEQFDRIMNMNLRSVYQLTMLAVPELIKTKGNIVNISSVCGLRAFPNVLAYNISKSAIDQFTRCVALELAPKGVRCNAVNPGVVVTNLHKRGGMHDEVYEKFLEHCKVTHALGRAGDVEEVANAICFLASDLATFTTGMNMPVDGGRHAMCPR